MLKPSTEHIEYISIAKYNAVKDYSTHSDKDLLFKRLLSASYEHEFSCSDTSICEKHQEIVNDWANLQNTKHVGQEALDVFLLSFFPKAYGIINWPELIMLKNIKQLSPENLRLGVLYSPEYFELWIIGKTRDYDLLDQVSGFVIQYEDKIGKTVNCVWATEEKMQMISQPEFILTM